MERLISKNKLVSNMTEIEETAKAIAETAKFGTTSVKATEKMLSFLSTVFKESIETSAGLIGERLQFFQWKRQLRMIDEVHTILSERDVDATIPILPKFAIPILEQASLEDDDDLQDIWCRLIANSLDPNFDSEIRYAFIDIIKNLTFLDAQILEVTYNSAVKYASGYGLSYFIQGTDSTKPEIFTDERFILHYTTRKENLLKTINCEKKQLDISIDNLLRVQCFKDSSLESSVAYAKNLKDVVCSDDSYSLTLLGVAFVEACIK